MAASRGAGPPSAARSAGAAPRSASGSRSRCPRRRRAGARRTLRSRGGLPVEGHVVRYSAPQLRSPVNSCGDGSVLVEGTSLGSPPSPGSTRPVTISSGRSSRWAVPRPTQSVATTQSSCVTSTRSNRAASRPSFIARLIPRPGAQAPDVAAGARDEIGDVVSLALIDHDHLRRARAARQQGAQACVEHLGTADGRHDDGDLGGGCCAHRRRTRLRARCVPAEQRPSRAQRDASSSPRRGGPVAGRDADHDAAVARPPRRRRPPPRGGAPATRGTRASPGSSRARSTRRTPRRGSRSTPDAVGTRRSSPR